MSLNTAHANNGVLIHAGEYILLYSDSVAMEFSGQDNPVFAGTKNGCIYLTTHRMIFNSKNFGESLQSFSFPFIALSEVDIEQPTFGSNYIKGKIRSQHNGNWTGEAKFKLYFKQGGAIDFGQAMLRAAKMAQRNYHNDDPPPYTPPNGGWYDAPPPVYQPTPGYYGWLPNNSNFSAPPPANTVFMTDNPPPYPGINSTPYQPGYPASTNQQNQGFHSGGGYTSGLVNPPPQFGAFSGYNNYPGNSQFASPNAATGFTAGPPTNSKEQEAAQSAYYDPNQPQTVFVPPPSYYESPPSYDSLGKKHQ